MTELDSGFEDGLQAAVLDDVEQKAPEIEQRMLLMAETNWRRYASDNGYDIDHIWRDVESDVRRFGNSVRISAQWPFSALFEFGVEPHTIEGNPYLSFVWESPPEGTRPPGAPKFVQTESVNWGSVTGGIPKARAVRDMLRELRGELRS